MSILDKYGIKEVADVTFYSIDANTGRPRTPVLFIDTAKVTTVEQSAEKSEATGGQGNPALISWDFGREITLNIDDAVFSPKSLAIMYGDGTVKDKIKVNDPAKDDGGLLYKTIIYTPSANAKPLTETVIDGVKYNLTSVAYTAADSVSGGANSDVKAVDLKKDTKYFASFYIKPTSAYEITVSPDKFPGAYYITMETFARSEATLMDEHFQIIIPKGKISSESTISLEAGGDPSVFSMKVTVLRANVDGEKVMMKLIQFSMGQAAADTGVALDTRLTAPAAKA